MRPGGLGRNTVDFFRFLFAALLGCVFRADNRP